MTSTLDQALNFHRAGRTADAARCYQEIIAAEPGLVAARHGLAIILLQSDQAVQALEHLEAAIAGGTENADLLNTLGVVLQQLGRTQDASVRYQAALKINPDHSKALANLGVCLYQLEDFQGSADAFTRAVRLDPNNAETHYNAGRAFRALGRFDEAERSARTALALSPNHISALIDLGLTLEAQADRTAAEESYRRAVALDPNAPEAHHNLAHLLLQSGRLAEGWTEFEWRWQTSDFANAESFNELPRWNGAPLSEGKLLVWAEQGVGDQILFSSLLSDLANLLGRDASAGPHFVLACKAQLVALFARTFPFAEVVSMAALKEDVPALKNISAQVPLGSLGGFLRPDMTTFPARDAYLVADQGRAGRLRATYKGARYKDARQEKPLIGLSWRSTNPSSGMAKSLDLADLAPVLCGIDATFIDLQYGVTAADLAVARSNGLDVVHDPEIDALSDLDGFAAKVAAMDLIITISNTTAHVAGALGVPCWVLVPAGKGQFWYWFLDREDSPWYPSLRLFRQATPGVWADVITAVGMALNQRPPTALRHI
jgi:Flp pilus assembly protein TadD